MPEEDTLDENSDPSPEVQPEPEQPEEQPQPEPEVVPREHYESLQKALRAERQKIKEMKTQVETPKVEPTSENSEAYEIIGEAVRTNVADIKAEISDLKAQQDAERRDIALERFLTNRKDAIKYAKEMAEIIQSNPGRFDEFNLETVYYAAKGRVSDRELAEARQKGVDEAYKNIEEKSSQPSSPTKSQPVDSSAIDYEEQWKTGGEDAQAEYLLKHVLKGRKK